MPVEVLEALHGPSRHWHYQRGTMEALDEPQENQHGTHRTEALEDLTQHGPHRHVGWTDGDNADDEGHGWS